MDLTLEAAWHGYYTALEEIRQTLEQTSRARTSSQHRAKAYHALMEMQAMTYNFIIAPRMTYPRIFSMMSWQSDIYTLGLNGADFKYGALFLDGAQSYRLHGRLGDIKLFLMQVMNGVFGEAGAVTTGNYDLADMDVAADGSFEIIFGGPPLARNWIPLDPAIGYQFVLFRRALRQPDDDAGELRIDPIGPPVAGRYDADEFDETAIALRIRRAEDFLRYLCDGFAIISYDRYIATAGGKNALGLMAGTEISEVGSPSSNYAFGVFDLDDDEALILEFDTLPDGAYWSFQLGDVWTRSLAFQERQSTLNDAQIAIDSDGHVRVIIARQDPGFANWLDTVGRREGTIAFRNYRARSAPVPASRKVRLAELPALLGATSALVTPAERAAALERRRLGFLKLYGE